MATTNHVTINHHGMAELLKSAAVRAIVREQADKVADRARASAPVTTGFYQGSIHVESVTTDRAVERVVADAPHALVIEAKTGNLARALGAGD